MMKKILLLAVIALGLFTACDESEGNGSNKQKIARMDIRDAATLFIAPSNFQQTRSTRASSNGDVLFKITEDGVIKQVTYLDENNKEVTDNYFPISVCVVDDSPYFFVLFSDGCYMVNRITGAVYESPKDVMAITAAGKRNHSGVQNFINESTIKTDKDGNIYYYKNFSGPIHKIDVSNVNNVTDEALTPESDDIAMYVVSGNGEMLYRYYREGFYHRLRTPSGRLIPFSPSFDGGLRVEGFAFQGFDGNIHVFDRRALYTIRFNSDGTYETEDILHDDCIERGQGHGLAYGKNGDFCLSNTIYGMVPPYLVKLHDRYLAVSTSGEVMVIDSKTDRSLLKMETHNVTDGMAISQLEYNDSYVYCCGQKSGNFSLLRFNPYTLESEAVVRDNDYEIYSFTVQEDNTINFNGLRLSDGKNILATIDKDGKVKVLEETGNSKITLYRLQ